MTAVTSQVHVIDGHQVRLASETPRREIVSREDINAGDFHCGKLTREEADSFRELYGIIEEEVSRGIVRMANDERALPGHCQPAVIKNLLT